MSITISGHITEPGQPESGFMIDPAGETFTQWGAGTEVLANRTPYVEAMLQGLTECSDYFDQEGTPAAPDLGEGTEFGRKRQQLAVQLLLIATGMFWLEADEEMRANYLADAHDTILAQPHLLQLPERERLQTYFPALALPSSF